MTFAIRVKVDASGPLKMIRGYEKQARFAAAKALSDLAYEGTGAVKKEMQAKLDRPTPFALRSTRYTRATKQNLTSSTYIEDKAPGGKQGLSSAEIFGHQFTGGPRNIKRLEQMLRRLRMLGPTEYIAPGAGAKLDRYGNMARTQVQQTISQLKVGLDASSFANKGARSKRNVRKAGRIFWSKGDKGLPRGAYIVPNRETGPRPLLAVIRRPNYRKRIDMQQVGQTLANARWQPLFDKALQQAMATAR
jgi:hypothetical protein